MKIITQGPFHIRYDPRIPWGDRLARAGYPYYGNDLFKTAGESEAQASLLRDDRIKGEDVIICTVINSITFWQKVQLLLGLPISWKYPDTLEVFKSLRQLEGGRYEFADRNDLLQMLIDYPEVFLNQPPVLALGNPLVKGETRFAAAWAGRQILSNLSEYGENRFSLFAQISAYPFPTGNYRYAMKYKRRHNGKH